MKTKIIITSGVQPEAAPPPKALDDHRHAASPPPEGTEGAVKHCWYCGLIMIGDEANCSGCLGTHPPSS